MARLKYWVWLSALENVRSLIKFRAAEVLGSPEAVFFAGEKELSAVPGLRAGEMKALLGKNMSAAMDILDVCEEKAISIITVQDAAYPERLRNIPDPPVVLYVMGNLPPVDECLFIGVVGTRKATPYGLKMANRMGHELAMGGAVVVSGLALGCDGAAMKAALAAGGMTVGVLGTPIDRIYPKENRELFALVKTHGALVSEYPPGAKTYPGNFKARNRIVTGLSLGVVVTEAPIHSGTRSTADHALEQGRDVFAVPGNADSEASAGCNDLVRQGAIPAFSGEEVLREYAHRFRPVSPKTGVTFPEVTEIPIKKEIDKAKDIVYIDTEELEKLPPIQQKILLAISRPDMHADDIIEATGLSAPETLAALTMLQVSGHVAQGAGRRYTRKK